MSDAEPRNPFTRRGFIFGAIIIAALAAAAILLAVTSVRGSGGRADTVAASTTAATTGATAPTNSDEVSVCNLPGYETENRLATPPAAGWSIVGTVAVPNSASVGPGRIDSDGFRSCYAHTAAGALFSAINFVAMSSDSRIASRLSEAVAPGPGRDVAIKDADPNASQTSVRLQLAGFTVTTYTAHEATIDLALQVTSSGGQLVSFPVVLKWVDGDWKIELADNGQPVFSSSPLQSLGGYLPWSGV